MLVTARRFGEMGVTNDDLPAPRQVEDGPRSLSAPELDVLPPLALPALRHLLPTGEALPVALARAWFARFPQVPLTNAYGGTVATLNAISYGGRVTRDEMIERFLPHMRIAAKDLRSALI